MEIKPNTCALNSSLTKEKTSEQEEKPKKPLRLSAVTATPLMFAILENAAVHFKDLPFTRHSNLIILRFPWLTAQVDTLPELCTSKLPNKHLNPFPPNLLPCSAMPGRAADGENVPPRSQ